MNLLRYLIFQKTPGATQRLFVLITNTNINSYFFNNNNVCIPIRTLCLNIWTCTNSTGVVFYVIPPKLIMYTFPDMLR